VTRQRSPQLRARAATPDDAPAIARIYNQGIEDRIATFETRLRSADDVIAWFDGVHPVVVVEEGGTVVGFAATSTYRPRECYAGVAEFSVYVARESRGRGAGRVAMEALIRDAERAGFWKLVSRVFPENVASLRLLVSVGFREVGTYENHARLDGTWRNVVIVERLHRALRRRVRVSDRRTAPRAAGGAPGEDRRGKDLRSPQKHS
jgi:phosphinothricin acetyltransferase